MTSRKLPLSTTVTLSYVRIKVNLFDPQFFLAVISHSFFLPKNLPNNIKVEGIRESDGVKEGKRGCEKEKVEIVSLLHVLDSVVSTEFFPKIK